MEPQEGSVTTVTVTSGVPTVGRLNGTYKTVEWDGTSFKGFFVDGIAQGYGTRQKKTFEFQKGYFVDGKLFDGSSNWIDKGVLTDGEVKGGQIWTGTGAKVVDDRSVFGIFSGGALVEEKTDFSESPAHVTDALPTESLVKEFSRVLDLSSMSLKQVEGGAKVTGVFKLIEAGGVCFEGFLVDGVPNGYGQRTGPNGQHQVGLFLKGEFYDGRAKWTAKGTASDGIVKGGQMWKGTGTRVYKDRTESGEFKRGLLHGKGKRITKDGKVQSGEFVAGQLKNGEGSFEWGGQWYQGTLKYFVPHGKAVWLDRQTKSSKDVYFDYGEIVPLTMVRRMLTVPRSPVPRFKKFRKANFAEVGMFVGSRLDGWGVQSDLTSFLLIGVWNYGVVSPGKLITSTSFATGEFRYKLLNGPGRVVYVGARLEHGLVSTSRVEEMENWVDSCRSPEDIRQLMAHISEPDFIDYKEGNFVEGKLDGEGTSRIGGVVKKGLFARGKLVPPPAAGARSLPILSEKNKRGF